VVAGRYRRRGRRVASPPQGDDATAADTTASASHSIVDT